MAKKKRGAAHEAPTSQGEAPAFRPLADKLKKLADEKRAEEAAKKKTSSAGEILKREDARRVAQPAPPPKPREGTLTKEERQDLDSMARDDAFFFERLMGGVVPLDADKRGRVHAAPEIKARPAPLVKPLRDADEEVRDHLMALVEGAARFEVTDDGRRLEGRRLDLASNAWRSFRRGELPIDARIDLHGKTSDEARTSLEAFLKEKRTRKDRVVLVVHGRGEHSPANVGVLRGEIAAWLSQGRSSQHVAAFATARAEDGGEGALYVLLRL